MRTISKKIFIYIHLICTIYFISTVLIFICIFYFFFFFNSYYAWLHLFLGLTSLALLKLFLLLPFDFLKSQHTSGFNLQLFFFREYYRWLQQLARYLLQTSDTKWDQTTTRSKELWGGQRIWGWPPLGKLQQCRRDLHNKQAGWEQFRDCHGQVGNSGGRQQSFQ